MQRRALVCHNSQLGTKQSSLLLVAPPGGATSSVLSCLHSCDWNAFLRSSDWSEFTCRHFEAGLSSYSDLLWFSAMLRMFLQWSSPSVRLEKLFCPSISTFSPKTKSDNMRTEFFLLLQNCPKTGPQSINRPHHQWRLDHWDQGALAPL